jgi:hypothetical protein
MFARLCIRVGFVRTAPKEEFMVFRSLSKDTNAAQLSMARMLEIEESAVLGGREKTSASGNLRTTRVVSRALTISYSEQISNVIFQCLYDRKSRRRQEKIL